MFVSRLAGILLHFGWGNKESDSTWKKRCMTKYMEVERGIYTFLFS